MVGDLIDEDTWLQLIGEDQRVHIHKKEKVGFVSAFW